MVVAEELEARGEAATVVLGAATAVVEKAVVGSEVEVMGAVGMAAVAAKDKEVAAAAVSECLRVRAGEAVVVATRVAVSKEAVVLEAVGRVAAVMAEVAMAVAALEVVG